MVMGYGLWVQHDREQFLRLLSAAQVETMRLVYEQQNSKQIARVMNVSPHTVDERVRKVLKKLEVSSRAEAAKLLADSGVFVRVTPYQTAYQSHGIGKEPPPADSDERRRRGIFDIGLPFPTESQPSNRHSSLERIIWPIIIAFLTILAFSGLYSILSGMSQVAR